MCPPKLNQDGSIPKKRGRKPKDYYLNHPEELELKNIQ
jgi:hypothetical protein